MTYLNVSNELRIFVTVNHLSYEGINHVQLIPITQAEEQIRNVVWSNKVRNVFNRASLYHSVQ